MSELTATTMQVALSLEQRLRRVQAVAGALFAVFVLLHLSNLALAPLGAEAFNDYQRFLRRFYQHPAIELLIVIGPLVAHAIAGIWLFLLRRKNPVTHKRPLASRLHTWAGAFLLLFIAGHILAVRGPSFFYGVYPEFEGLAFSMWYLPYYFYPYYFLLALAGFYHATNGLRTLALRQGVRVSLGVQRGVTVFAAIIFAASLLSLGGVLVDVNDPQDNDFARLLADLFDTDHTKPVRF